MVITLGCFQNFVSAQYFVNKMMEFDQIFICIDCNQILGWTVTHQFLQIYNRVMALGYCQNVVSAQNLVNQFVVFDQILYMH